MGLSKYRRIILKVTAGVVAMGTVATVTAARGSSSLSLASNACVLWFVTGAEEDKDADGLTDEVEEILGANPYHADTDMDGITDGWEVWHGLDPVDPGDAEHDDDGDGLSNIEESLAGTLPYSKDSDGDGFWDLFELQRGSEPTVLQDTPYSGVPGDVDRNGVLDAIDVQLVIRGAIGLGTPCPTEVNGVCGANALDVQFVVNACLGSN